MHKDVLYSRRFHEVLHKGIKKKLFLQILMNAERFLECVKMGSV